jgi:hypothetical protein
MFMSRGGRIWSDSRNLFDPSGFKYDLIQSEFKKESNWSDLIRIWHDLRSNDLQSNRNLSKIFKKTQYINWPDLNSIRPDSISSKRSNWSNLPDPNPNLNPAWLTPLSVPMANDHRVASILQWQQNLVNNI